MDNNNHVPSEYPPSYAAAVLPNNVSVEPKTVVGGPIFIPPVAHAAGAGGYISEQNHYTMPFAPGFIPNGAPIHGPPIHGAPIHGAPIGHAQNQYQNNLNGQPNYTPNAPALPRYDSAIVATTTHTAQGTTTVYKRHIPKWQYALMAIFIMGFLAGLIWTIVAMTKNDDDFQKNKPDWAKNR